MGLHSETHLFLVYFWKYSGTHGPAAWAFFFKAVFMEMKWTQMSAGTVHTHRGIQMQPHTPICIVLPFLTLPNKKWLIFLRHSQQIDKPLESFPCKGAGLGFGLELQKGNTESVPLPERGDLRNGQSGQLCVLPDDCMTSPLLTMDRRWWWHWEDDHEYKKKNSKINSVQNWEIYNMEFATKLEIYGVHVHFLPL